MTDLAYTLTLRRLVAASSDRLQEVAARFADNHRDLLPRRITNAQLYGLANVVRGAHHLADIQRFMRHQGGKAERAGRPAVQEYWAALAKALADLQAEARGLQQQAGRLPAGLNPKGALDALHRQLIEAFVQHLIAHSLYWTPVEEVNAGRHGS